MSDPVIRGALWPGFPAHHMETVAAAARTTVRSTGEAESPLFRPRTPSSAHRWRDPGANVLNTNTSEVAILRRGNGVNNHPNSVWLS